MTVFEAALLNEMTRLRKIFADRDAGRMSVWIRVDGPTMTDELRIVFHVQEEGWQPNDVNGSNLDACVEEYFRRKGWTKHNNYLALPNVTTPPAED